MFDAQRLLGQVLREAAGGGLGGGSRSKRRSGSLTGLPRGLEAKVGMGLLGLAIAAYEHFRQPPAAATQTVASVPPVAASLAVSAGPAMPPPPQGRPAPALPDRQGEAEDLDTLGAGLGLDSLARARLAAQLGIQSPT